MDVNVDKFKDAPYYVGIKRIQAIPEVKDGIDGYAVKYADGYESWSPKGVFEEAYLKLNHEAGSEIMDTDVVEWIKNGHMEIATLTNINIDSLKDKVETALKFVLGWATKGLAHKKD